MARLNIMIRRSALLLGGAMLLAACGTENAPTNGGQRTSMQPPVEAPAPIRPDTAARAAPAAPAPPAPPTDRTTRQPSAPTPCPGIAIRRPPGSNCLGILPSACAADRLGIFVGRGDSQALRREVTAIVGHTNIRWIRPGEAVIENLDPARLNVALSAAGRIAGVDCG